MSLINDALKRAKESHGQHSSPPPDSPMRPVEPPPRNGMPAWLWLVIIVLFVGIGAFLIGQSMREKRVTISDTSTTNTAMPPVAKAESIKPTPAPEIISQSTPPVETPQAKIETPSNPPTVVIPVATAPAPLKLQSIIFDPRRPSVMISGKLLFVGDRIGEFRVIEIQRNSATLVGGGQTNILSLED